MKYIFYLAFLSILVVGCEKKKHYPVRYTGILEVIFSKYNEYCIKTFPRDKKFTKEVADSVYYAYNAGINFDNYNNSYNVELDLNDELRDRLKSPKCDEENLGNHYFISNPLFANDSTLALALVEFNGPSNFSHVIKLKFDVLLGEWKYHGLNPYEDFGVVYGSESD